MKLVQLGHDVGHLDPWYSAALSGVAVPFYVPLPHAQNRFNDGASGFALRYLAPDPAIALLEVVALYGTFATGFVPGPPPARRWTVFRYKIVPPCSMPINVVDFTDPAARDSADTTVQELTGDWLGYHHRSMGLSARPPAVQNNPRTPAPTPTQRLANTIDASTNAHGFLAPSAKIPVTANLVLFFDRLPPGCLKHTGTANVVL